MCGIYCSISPSGIIKPDPVTVRLLQARGPDCCNEVSVNIGNWRLTSCATVLALRGERPTPQPLIDETTDSIFCWNGEAWLFDNEPVQGNDTQQIFTKLLKSSSEDQVRDVFKSISGPFAFMYLDAPRKTLFYGRDRLGRRSLLQRLSGSGELILSSVTPPEEKSFVEVDSGFIHTIKLEEHLEISRHQWKPYPPVNPSLPLTDNIEARPSDETITQFIEILKYSLRLRVTDIPSFQGERDQAKVAILFSGGLDCTLLARLVHEILPPHEPVDLLNVAFENHRRDLSGYEQCPDRQTGRKALTELVSTCPRAWRFVAINITFDKFKEHRPNILQLMLPHNTEMDLSISAALYFAARCQGSAESESSYLCPAPVCEPPYISSARVLLSGLGADELFAGYTRHATAFRRGGFPSLIEELQIDWSRIGNRNLGRDDRIISHWGKEVRYPYLDERFSQWVLNLPVWEKCGFTTTCEDPTKLLLRLAMYRLGMPTVAQEKKRAIQFGARSAGLEGKRRGTDVVA